MGDPMGYGIIILLFYLNRFSVRDRRCLIEVRWPLRQRVPAVLCSNGYFLELLALNCLQPAASFSQAVVWHTIIHHDTTFRLKQGLTTRHRAIDS